MHLNYLALMLIQINHPAKALGSVFECSKTLRFSANHYNPVIVGYMTISQDRI